MTHITFGIIALNSQPFLEYNLRSLYPYAHQIIVVEGAAKAAASLADAQGHSMDDSLTMLQHFQAKEDPKGKVTVVSAVDEGYADGLWPEKDEMSQAYAKRVTGDWLWQVDSDEFYRTSDLEAIIKLLEEQPDVSGISFPFYEFWGGFDYVTTGKWYIQEFTEVARVFRWGPGYRYQSHRPPTVVDGDGQTLPQAGWLSGRHMRARGIYMYHYSYVLPKQALQKVGYYSNVAWSDAFRDNEGWLRDSYRQLRRPLFLGERGWPILQWLERFKGQHPAAIRQLRVDLESGQIKEEQRPSADLEALLGSPWYRLGTRLLRLVMTPYWYIQRALRRKEAA